MLETRVEAALARLGGLSIEAFLTQAGVRCEVCDEPARFGTAVVRGYYDEAQKRIVVCAQALEPNHPIERVVAHEVFHVLDPRCPSRIAEAAANAFAERVVPK